MSLYLVTGGCGFIGSHLVDRLLGDGHQVRILDDMSSGKLANIPSRRVDFHRGDVADPLVVKNAARRVDGCFHLAAIASVQKCNEDWLAAHAVNLGGAINVMHAAAGQRTPCPVVYASSAAVYGDCTDPPIAETAPTRPLTPYGADKKSSEDQAFAFASVKGLPSTGLRFFNVYGTRQDPASPYSGVIAKFTDLMMAKRAVTLDGDGSQTRDFIHVSDVVAAMTSSMAALAARKLSGATVFNVCTGQSISISDLANTLGGILDLPPSVQNGPARPGDIIHSLGNPEALALATGFRAKTMLRDGLADLLAEIGQKAERYHACSCAETV